MPELVEKLIAEQLNRPAPAGMLALAERLRALHGDNVQAVIGYGSCLRDGVSPDKITDLYVLLNNYADMPDGWGLRAGNSLLPPNVYYLEAPFEGDLLRAKYATVSLKGFEEWVSGNTRNPYFWARFAQPCALIYARDDEAAQRVVSAIRTAIHALISQTLPLMQGPFTSHQLWSAALGQTYQTEWRSEGKSRAAEIISAGEDYYQRITPPVLAGIAPGHAVLGNDSFSVDTNHQRAASCRRAWQRRRITGRIFATMRLLKAAFTFQGGIDYLLWKVARHSGVQITPTAFQRRHPLLGAPLLAWKVYRRGGFR